VFRRAFIGAVVVAAVSTPAASAAPTPVLASRANELQPAGAPGVLAWSQSSRLRPNLFSVFVRFDGQPRFRVNPRGTVAITSSGAIDGTTLVYSQRRRRAATSDLRFYDLAARTFVSVPAGVNTRRHEWGASLSEEWLHFARSTFSTSTERIMLHNTVTHEERQLGATSGRRYAQPGDVSGNFVAWTKCPRFSRCQTYVYDIAAGTTIAVPNPLGRSQYAASVTADGTVYFVESTNIDCGRGVRLWRYPLGGAREPLLGFRRGRDVAVTSPVDNPDGTTTVFFDRFVCRTGAADIYRLIVP
jgi:Tol biopolymer transport system component